MKKRGVSTIVTTILIVLMALAAIIIVWNVVKKTVTEKSEEVDIGVLLFEGKIQKNMVYINKTANLAQISFTRGSDDMDLAELRIIVQGNENNLEYYIDSTLLPKPLETKVYVLNISGITIPIKKIDVYPISTKGKIGYAISYQVSGNELQMPPGGWANLIINPGKNVSSQPCVYGSWNDIGCGNPCEVGQMYQTRQVISGTGCSQIAQCNSTHPSCQSLGSGLISYWSFENNLNDNKGVNNLTFYGTLAYVEGKNGLGKALDFNGINNYARRMPASINVSPGSFSCAIWIKPRNVSGGWRAIFEYDRYDDPPGVSHTSWFGMWLSSSGNSHARVGSATYNSPGILQNNEWYFLVVTFNRTDNKTTHYINGIFNGSTTLSIASSWSAFREANFTIGASMQNSVPAEFFNGAIDEFMIYNRVLSAGEINSMYETNLAELSREVYYDKVYGGWLGEIAGNFLGMPTEGYYSVNPNPASSIYYNATYNIALINGTCNADGNYELCKVNSQTDDDTSMEWVDLWMLENYGLGITNNQIKTSWLTHILNGDGTYFANRWAWFLMNGTWQPSNTTCSGFYTCMPSGNTCPGGCVPPDSGKYNYNPYYDYIDAQIESEVFGMFAPGMTNVAGSYSDKFARVTNDGYAVDFAKFYAMTYSEAFFDDNVSMIIENVKTRFPINSVAVQIVNNVTSWWKTYPNWRDTRTQIYNKYYNPPEIGGRGAAWIHSKVNFASTIMALLYSQDVDKGVQFDKGIQIAALAGWDNDCNAPTTAGVLGIIAGANNIPAKWKTPIRNFYKNTNRNPTVLGNDYITNIANRTVNLGEQFILANKGVKTLRDGEIVYKIKR